MNDNIVHLNPHVRQAHEVKIFFCGSSECLRPHVLLYDHHGNVFAQFVCPDTDDDGGGFAARLYYASCKAAIERKIGGKP